MITRDSAGVLLTTLAVDPATLPAWRLEPEPRFTLDGSETGDSAAFALVRAVRFLSGGGLAVVDAASSRILLYDASGQYRGALGKRGAGPGELRLVESITPLANDTVAAWDPGLRRLSWFREGAGFVRSVSVAEGGALDSWPADAWPWRDSMLVVLHGAVTPQESVPAGSGVRPWRMRAFFTLRDRNGVTLARTPDFDGTYTGLDERGDTRLPFANRAFAAVGGDRICFGSGTSFSIDCVGPGLAPVQRLDWPSRVEALDAAEVEHLRAEAVARAGRRIPPERAGQAFARSFAPEILPSNRPAIGRLLIPGDGSLWVERFEPIQLGSAMPPFSASWTVLSPAGAPLARLELPPGTRLEDVRGDLALVVRLDSLEVQVVEARRLVRQ